MIKLNEIKNDFLKALTSDDVDSYRIHAQKKNGKIGITAWYTEEILEDIKKEIIAMGDIIIKIEKKQKLNEIIKNIFDPTYWEYEDAFKNTMDEEDEFEEYGHETIEEIIDEVKQLKFPLTIYRGIATPISDINQIKKTWDSFNGKYFEGRSWTTDIGVARKFGYVIIEATLDKNNIDWVGTISRRIMHRILDEQEINVLNPNKLKNLKIVDDGMDDS